MYSYWKDSDSVTIWIEESMPLALEMLDPCRNSLVAEEFLHSGHIRYLEYNPEFCEKYVPEVGRKLFLKLCRNMFLTLVRNLVLKLGRNLIMKLGRNMFLNWGEIWS